MLDVTTTESYDSFKIRPLIAACAPIGLKRQTTQFFAEGEAGEANDIRRNGYEFVKKA